MRWLLLPDLSAAGGYAVILLQLSPLLQPPQVVVSVAAGVTIKQIEAVLPAQIGVIRVMPNTPCLIKQGVLAVSAGQYVAETDLRLVECWLKNMGSVHIVPEKLLDAVTGVSGSGPAYVYLFLRLWPMVVFWRLRVLAQGWLWKRVA